MQRGDGRDTQRREEIENIGAVVAAEDPVLVLDRYQAHVAVIHELGRAGVVALHGLADLVPDVLGVLVLSARIRHRQGDREHPLASRRDRLGEVTRERRDPAAPWGIGADERDAHVGSSRYHPQRSAVLSGSFGSREAHHRRRLRSPPPERSLASFTVISLP